MSSLVILAVSVCEISCGKTTDRQTNKHINAAEHPTHTTAVDVGKNGHAGLTVCVPTIFLIYLPDHYPYSDAVY